MNKKLGTLIRLSLCALCLFSAPVFSAEFKDVDGSLRLEFPKNHGAHPDFKTEWWYFVGHLNSDKGQTFGFEMTFFRVGLAPEIQSKSNWRHHSLYLTHAALTADDDKEFYYDERVSRGAFNEAGAEQNKLHVYNGDWFALMEDNIIRMQSKTDDFAFNLELHPAKKLVLHGENGFSRKGPEHGEASYYFSFTRLQGGGTLSYKGQDLVITQATAWMDHEVTSQELPDGIQGWDWFAIQLDNNEEIMVYQLRQSDGNKSPFSKGSYVNNEGRAENLKHDQFEMRSIDSWQSKKTGITYPSGWYISIPHLDYEFKVIPTVKQQELMTEESTGVNYWEGRSRVEAAKSGRPVKGQAYVELTGYDKPLDYR